MGCETRREATACACLIPVSRERAFVLTPLAALEPRLTLYRVRARVRCSSRRAPAGHHLPLWMGIVNVTPDSFSDGGELADLQDVEERAAALAAAGARAHRPRCGIDAARRDAGCRPMTSGRGWSQRSADSSICYRGSLLRPRLSVDTYHVETARRALALGVDVINDVSGLTTAVDDRARRHERRRVRRDAQPRRAGRQVAHAAGGSGSDDGRRAMARASDSSNGNAPGWTSGESCSTPELASARTHCNRYDCCATSSACSALGLRLSRRSFAQIVHASESRPPIGATAVSSRSGCR